MHYCVVKCSHQGRDYSALLIQHTQDKSVEDLLDEAHRFVQGGKSFVELVLLRAPVAEQFSEDALLDALRSREPVGGGSFLEAILQASSDLTSAFARFPTVPIHVMFLNELAVSVSGNINPTASITPETPVADGDEGFIDQIRNGELEHIVSQSRALLPSVPGCHYLTPSHRQVRSFVRVGNIQYSRLAIDAVCFWLIPFAAKADAILLDTWSISSIGFNLSRILSILDGRPLMPVEMLSQYLEAGVTSQVTAAESIDRLAAELYSREKKLGARAICLVSATHTGSLVNVLRELVDLSDFQLEFDFVALFKLGDTGDAQIRWLVDLSQTSAFMSLVTGQGDSPASIPIDPQVYFPLRYCDIEIEIREDAARDIKDFIVRYDHVDVFSVHRTHITDGPPRHHAIHVDTRALIQSNVFRNRLYALLKGLSQRPAAILSPRHAAATDFVSLLEKFYSQVGNPIPNILHSDLVLRAAGPTANDDEETRRLLGSIDADASLLILDDAFITGARLVGFQTRLRGLEFVGKIQYLVAIARPDSLEYWNDVRRKLEWRHASRRAVHRKNEVLAVETVCLPNWQADRCPWCIEKAHYDSVLQETGELDKRARARHSQLANFMDDGLRVELFLCEENAAPFKLEVESVFSPTGQSDATVFASVASAVQIRRTERPQVGPALGPRRYPLATVLKSAEYLVHTYTDSILRASIIRACTRDELEYTDPNLERLRAEQAHALIESSIVYRSNLRAEMELAIALGKFPTLATTK